MQLCIGSFPCHPLHVSAQVVRWVQWADVLALSGDSADNIPGVKGVGIKTAPNLVRAHGDIEGVLAAAPDEKKKVGVKLCLCPILLLDLCCRSS